MNKIITFIINSDFGILKKPDINDYYLTYNMLHKPALLGILGSIAGLKGYTENGKLPEYYNLLKDLKLSIKPLKDNKGNFSKTMIGYNNSVGYANKDGNLQIYEQVLLKPSYKCYIELDIENEIQKTLFNNILNCESYYIPYLGKNENYLWWSEAKEITIEEYKDTSIKISSIFIKENLLKDNIALDLLNYDSGKFIYFERLPYCFDENMFQYVLKDFVYTNNEFKFKSPLSNLFKTSEDEIIQLF